MTDPKSARSEVDAIVRDAMRRMNTMVPEWVVNEHADSLIRALLRSNQPCPERVAMNAGSGSHVWEHPADCDACNGSGTISRDLLLDFLVEEGAMERFGTYLDPREYGQEYDHHTFTNAPTEEGKRVALYRALSPKERTQ